MNSLIIKNLYNFIDKILPLLKAEIVLISNKKDVSTLDSKKDIVNIINKLIVALAQIKKLHKESNIAISKTMHKQDKIIIQKFLEKHKSIENELSK